MYNASLIHHIYWKLLFTGKSLYYTFRNKSKDFLILQ